VALEGPRRATAFQTDVGTIVGIFRRPAAEVPTWL
jgi:hypothetical protein